MKKILFPVLIALILGTATAGARPYENSSVVGQVPDRILVTVKAGTTLSLDKSAGTPQVGVPRFVLVARSRHVRGHRKHQPDRSPTLSVCKTG